MSNKEMIEKTTRAKSVNSFLSGLSVIDMFKKAEKDSKIYIAKAKYGLNYFLTSLKESISPKSLVAYGLTASIAFSLAGCHRKDKQDNNDSSLSTFEEAKEQDLIPETDPFKILLNKSKSETQRDVLLSVGKFLTDFNIRFADKYVEDVQIIDKDTQETRTVTIKPALTWDEAMAMSLAYNDFSKNELIEILNGAEISSRNLFNAYQMSYLQLMCSHVLETRDNQVRVDALLRDEKAKNFYNKYHKMFLDCKETTGDERLQVVEKFYNELYKDFPITDDVRLEGIAHSDTRNSVEAYKLSILPMVFAGEMLFQSLEIDHTMAQKASDYLNDLGACNMIDDIFEKAETISLTTTPNDEYADYAAIRALLISFLHENDAYNVDDENRDLSKLTLFQEILWGYVNQPQTYVVTTTVTEYYTVTEETRTKDRDEAVDLAGEDAVSAAEKAAQEALDRENQEAKDKAEKEADEKANQKQQEEDKKKDDLQHQVDNDNKDYQDKIDNANNKGGAVNEGDLGHGTNFDRNHSDGNGNLNDSVTDITTDPSGDKTNEPLPDPNASYSSRSTESYAKATTPETDASIYSYEEPYMKEIDAYINALANTSIETNDSPKVYYYA